jgi:hypothetical protein
VDPLLRPVYEIKTAPGHHQTQKNEKAEYADQDFHRRIAALRHRSAGHGCGRGSDWGGCRRTRLSRAAFVAESGPIRQRVSTIYAKSSH